MKKKFLTLSLWSLILAVIIFALSFYIYHFVRADGAFTLVYEKMPGKPFVSEMLADLGVLIFFSSILNFMISRIFFKDGIS